MIGELMEDSEHCCHFKIYDVIGIWCFAAKGQCQSYVEMCVLLLSLLMESTDVAVYTECNVSECCAVCGADEGKSAYETLFALLLSFPMSILNLFIS